MAIKLYLAGPFFTEEERKIVEEHAQYFRAIGYEVFVPMEHKIPDAEELPNNEWARLVFLQDKKAIDESDIVVVLEDRLTGDTGTAWECGYAYGIGKKVKVLEVQPYGVKSLMMVNCAYNWRAFEFDEQKQGNPISRPGAPMFTICLQFKD